MRVAKTIELDEGVERELRVLARGRRVEARLQQRALVVLLAAQGLQNKDIAVEAGLDRRQVALWRQRFRDGGIDALRKDAPRSGRPATVTAEMESRIVHVTLHSKKGESTVFDTDEHPRPGTTLEQLGKDAAKQGYKAGEDGFVEVVWVIADGKAKARQVTTGIQGDDAIEVKTGLKDGETVVSGSYRAISRDLENDMAVTIKQPGKPGGDDEKAKD